MTTLANFTLFFRLASCTAGLREASTEPTCTSRDAMQLDNIANPARNGNAIQYTVRPAAVSRSSTISLKPGFPERATFCTHHKL